MGQAGVLFHTFLSFQTRTQFDIFQFTAHPQRQSCPFTSRPIVLEPVIFIVSLFRLQWGERGHERQTDRQTDRVRERERGRESMREGGREREEGERER